MPVFKGQRLSGEIVPPPDKSITHRALLVGAIARKGLRIVNPLEAGDTCSTVDCLQKLGKNLRLNPGEIRIEPGPLREAREILNCGNSGTTARLLSGILSAQNFFSVMDGDDSLKQRPMKRVVEPLRKMGAKIFGRAEDSLLPLSIRGGPLKGSFFELDLPSAQVKSAIILAALSAEGTTIIKEKIKARDHLERMLRWLGIDLKVQDKTITLEGKTQVEGGEISIPGDFSSAAFFISAAILAPDSRIIIKDVGLNSTRIGLIRVLERMGAKLSVLNLKYRGYEEVADLEVRAGSLKATEITGKEIPSLIDEIPLLALLGTQAEGITRITGASELRHKETDRILTISENLRQMGARIEELENGLIIEGPTPLRGNHLNSYGDHRIALTLAIASIIAVGETYIEGFDCIRISYPDFLRDLYSLARF
ncbi:MAG: 3-phosphoshikimate 1-carboxyvinyltransferase [Candidatus Saccharicenans sp.]|uniref:3-phosphoshikimate 1-carboxyvinyltransferase n=1 Tax=Candidatus Saccharicenans sp. TaxID=2819258 RepID=UPI00404AF04B